MSRVAQNLEIFSEEAAGRSRRPAKKKSPARKAPAKRSSPRATKKAAPPPITEAVRMTNELKRSPFQFFKKHGPAATKKYLMLIPATNLHAWVGKNTPLPKTNKREAVSKIIELMSTSDKFAHEVADKLIPEARKLAKVARGYRKMVKDLKGKR